MKLRNICLLFAVAFGIFSGIKEASAQNKTLKLIFIRHGEKPAKGDNLSCQGLNRALLLPDLIGKKFGIPDFLYVPSLSLGEATKHARMFQTITPLAVKYNLPINSNYTEKDSAGIAQDLLHKNGTILIVWEHKAIKSIVYALGIADNLTWPDDDYDSIWVVTIVNGKPLFSKDKENLSPLAKCK